MIRISQLKLPVNHTPDALEKKICQQLKIKKEELSSWKIVRRSLDARKKPDLKFVYVVDVDTPKERKILHRMQKVNDKNIMLINKTEYQFPAGGTEKLKTAAGCHRKWSGRIVLRMGTRKSRTSTGCL